MKKLTLKEFFLNPTNFTVTAWIAILAFAVPTAYTAISDSIARAEQSSLHDLAAIERLARAEASILFQEGEITPISIKNHLESIFNHASHDFPQWAKRVDYSFGAPKINCIIVNDIYREIYRVREDCFGKSDRDIYAEVTGITDFNEIVDGLDEYRKYDLYVARQEHGFCLRAEETVYPWYAVTGMVVDVIKCRYDFGDHIIIIGTIPSQERRPDPEDYPERLGAAIMDGKRLKIVKA